jgi:selenocysteine lyase/cysteine desulfurase
MSASRGRDGGEWSRRGFLGALGTGSIVALTRDSAHRASSRQVIEATTQAWYALETNPTAMGYYGLAAASPAAMAEETRQRAARLLGCAVEELVVTRSTTDGMNAVAQGMRLASGDRVLTSDQEHPGGSMCWQHLARRSGGVVDTVAIPPGENDPAAVLQRLSQAITPRTRVISISHVLSSTGLRMPIREISALARSRGITCVVDGAQAAGAIGVNVKELGCHAYATSGHKWLMGPKGTGLLYLSSDASEMIQPMQLEDKRAYYSESSGVGNLPGAVGLGVAIDALMGIGPANVERHNVGLRNQIYNGLRELGVGRVVPHRGRSPRRSSPSSFRTRPPARDSRGPC